MHARDIGHDGSDLLALLLENLQVVPKNLERKRTLGASHRFSDVVFDGLGEVPDRSWVFFQRTVHGGDQFLFVLMKYRAPLIVRLQVHEIFGVAESPSVGAVIGTAGLRHNGFHLRERRENIAGIGREFLAFRETCAIGQSAARPDGAFIEVRQELRADDATKPQVKRSGERRDTNNRHDRAMLNRPAQPIDGNAP